MSDVDLPKIGAPATRALAEIGVTRLEHLVDRSETELLALHGFGPLALRVIRDELAARGQSPLKPAEQDVGLRGPACEDAPQGRKREETSCPN